jgi:hypothetical protein
MPGRAVPAPRHPTARATGFPRPWSGPWRAWDRPRGTPAPQGPSGRTSGPPGRERAAWSAYGARGGSMLGPRQRGAPWRRRSRGARRGAAAAACARTRAGCCGSPWAARGQRGSGCAGGRQLGRARRGGGRRNQGPRRGAGSRRGGSEVARRLRLAASAKGRAKGRPAPVLARGPAEATVTAPAAGRSGRRSGGRRREGRRTEAAAGACGKAGGAGPSARRRVAAGGSLQMQWPAGLGFSRLRRVGAAARHVSLYAAALKHKSIPSVAARGSKERHRRSEA